MRSPVKRTCSLGIFISGPVNPFTIRDYRRADSYGLWRQRDGYRIRSISTSYRIKRSAISLRGDHQRRRDCREHKTNHFILFFLVRTAIYFAQGRRVIDRRSSRSRDRTRQQIYGLYNPPDRWFPAPGHSPFHLQRPFCGKPLSRTSPPSPTIDAFSSLLSSDAIAPKGTGFPQAALTSSGHGGQWRFYTLL